MKCPNCNKEMRDNSYEYYSIGGWDLDYPDLLHEEYWCQDCLIRFTNGKWEMPQYLIATEKQLKAGIIINRNTGIKMPPPLKKLMWQYIQDNMELSKRKSEEYKNQRKQAFVEWCEENSDWLPEYF